MVHTRKDMFDDFLFVEQFRQGLSYVGVGLPRATGPALGNARFKITAKVLIAHLNLVSTYYNKDIIVNIYLYMLY